MRRSAVPISRCNRRTVAVAPELTYSSPYERTRISSAPGDRPLVTGDSLDLSRSSSCRRNDPHVSTVDWLETEVVGWGRFEPRPRTCSLRSQNLGLVQIAITIFDDADASLRSSSLRRQKWVGADLNHGRSKLLPDSNQPHVTIPSLANLLETEVVGWGRFELPASSMSRRCHNQTRPPTRLAAFVPRRVAPRFSSALVRCSPS